jgi:hypothetical protein
MLDSIAQPNLPDREGDTCIIAYLGDFVKKSHSVFVTSETRLSGIPTLDPPLNP